jgi:quercetin dioxygenase-like cupin family protein
MQRAEADMTSAMPTHTMLTSGEMTWVDGPPTLPAGVKVAVMEGDPRAEGPFTMRLLFPAGTTVAPHFHPGIEHATVLSGTVRFGIGEAFDVTKLRVMPAGSFIMICAGCPHFGDIVEDTVIQAPGIGPWQTIYVNPADAPAASR